VRGPAADRVLSRVVYDHGCWLFTGHVDRNGYGLVTNRGGSVLAHRIVYEAVVGAIPNGLVADHLCRFRSCCNPLHIELVTQAENVRRSVCPPALNGEKEFCDSGHEFTPENTFWRKEGGRTCRECRRRWQRESAARHPRRRS
jgi:hypothetical protein